MFCLASCHKSVTPSLCNNSLRLRRLHWRPALAVRVEVICNKKQSGNIPPQPQPASQTEAAWPRSSDTPETEATLDTSHSADWANTTDLTLQNQREFVSGFCVFLMQKLCRELH